MTDHVIGRDDAHVVTDTAPRHHAGLLGEPTPEQAALAAYIADVGPCPPEAMARAITTTWALTERTGSDEPLVVRWEGTFIHPDDPAEDTVVCCTTADGRPVALLLDAEHAEALAGPLLDGGEVPQ
ncbi:hypothetical protein CDO52_12765 [Nocardiopsis gilva YIM 90087]|uniref:Uncharacterized protein n=1 Tax=Nocardiopsis gilva YIM 90087 TaxID=1235441 RepID=A0A223S5X6_9ACTN|nr:hypothetical protein [Nocardiopsis gilva]ASU83543.1 hypothetical protein CDO52_12765 [Nocardiopsis gilva YIM 90087]